MRGIVLGIAVLAGGCAIHPTPDYNATDKTAFIVKRIRCEARNAVKARFVKAARASKDERTNAIAEKLEQEKKFSYKDINFAELDDATRSFLKRYSEAAVAYSFLFDMTESGGVGANLDLVRPLSAGVLSAGFGAGAELKRQNQRAFLMNDTFSGLLTKLSLKDCQELEAGSDWLYPIRGGIGLDEMANTFIDLDLTDALAKGQNDAPTMIDTLEFTTELTASAHPSLVLAAAGRRWQTTKFTGSETGLHAGRTDKNKVEVSFSAAIPAERTVKSIFAKSRSRPRSVSTPAEENAGKAIFNKNTIQFFSNSLELQRRSGLPNAQ